EAALVDGDRELLTVARIDATGVDYRAPARISVDDLRVSKPWALVDRDERGQLSLRAALAAKPRATPAAGAAQDSASSPADVALSPAQPYLPIGARVSGNVEGEAQISARFDPFTLSVRGGAAVKELGIGDANRQLLTAGRARADGVDVQWPGGMRVTRVEIEKPWVLFEREASGRFPLVELLTPRARAAAPTPVAARDPGPREPT